MGNVGIDFEPSIVFPSEPIDAARIFLGVMAYPERGAGQPGGQGAAFAAAMWSRLMWSRRKAKGLHQLRRERGTPTFNSPQLREFEGTYFRGMRRLHRRQVAYGLIGTRLVRTLVAAHHRSSDSRSDPMSGYRAGARIAPTRPEIWSGMAPSLKSIISGDVDRWATRFGLNETGRAADPDRKAKDLVRRAYLQSRPVLHMAHALEQAIKEFAPVMPGICEGDNLLVMLINCECWIWQAIEWAERWRSISGLHILPGIAAEQMIALSMSPKRPHDNAPC